MVERVQNNASYLDGKSTTGTTTRVKDTSCTSGMCPICTSDCSVLCEISLAAFRGRESLYPDPFYFGYSTAGALKDFRLDWSHFNIQASMLKAEGIAPDPDQAFFQNVDVSSSVGGIQLKMPAIIGAYGSTEVARIYWDGLAAGAALTGILITIGENICGMDPETKLEKGKVVESSELKRRVESFRKFWDGKYGDIAVQTNVEDQKLGIDIYALSKLEVNIIERKWGQGAKAIGGEVRIKDIERAIMLKKRGYFVIPDPEDPAIQEAFKQGIIHSFERHSRVGIPTMEGFLEDIDQLREQGAKKISLKTGAYNAAEVAFTMKAASEAKIDFLTFDGAGGGTGMSPVPMMDEMSTPTVYLESQVLKCAEILKKKGKHVPDLVMAGGFIDESQTFKSIALSNFGNGPHIKAILFGRSPLTAVMKSSHFTSLAERKALPRSFSQKYGDSPEKFFICAPELKAKYNERFKEIPWEAIGLYGYMNERVKVGLQQLMAGARKWKLELIDRDDLIALTERASKTTGIPLPEVSQDFFEKYL